ncbi:MAG: GntR family transcriptional regulator [Bacteroidetes bacterium]|nr:GntR family transcriptional regulator [Bacteroidota bacterium]
MEFIEQQPIYMQIADHFCDNILQLKWNANERIPSVREIAVAMEVNPNTAMRAFVYLQEREIIYNKRGIGYFVNEDGKEKALELKRRDFIKKEIPEFFKKMQVLNFTCKEVEELYEKSTKNNNK